MSNLKYKHTAYTSAQWASLNPVIVENEIVIESDTKRTKIGNGISTYNELEYADANSVGNYLGSIKPTDAAPTPARNGNYIFSAGGVVSYLIGLFNIGFLHIDPPRTEKHYFL